MKQQASALTLLCALSIFRFFFSIELVKQVYHNRLKKIKQARTALLKTIVLCNGITPADREASINLAIIPSVSLKTYISFMGFYMKLQSMD